MMNQIAIEKANISQVPDSACGYEAYGSYSELLEANWEELVIQFDREKGKHVVRTACCPMAPVC
jgi:hypothetical protein